MAALQAFRCDHGPVHRMDLYNETDSTYIDGPSSSVKSSTSAFGVLVDSVEKCMLVDPVLPEGEQLDRRHSVISRSPFDDPHINVGQIVRLLQGVRLRC